MKSIRVEFSVMVDNPEYRYGDLNKPSTIKIYGKGRVVDFIYSTVNIDSIGSGLTYAIVVADSGLFYWVHLVNLKEVYGE
jgi:hypothetical protein